MSEPKFTPGPWYSFPSVPSEGFNGYWLGADGNPIGVIFSPNVNQREANANLIAAAPRLYQALEDLIEAWEVEESIEGLAYINAQDALAKARGE